MDGLDWVWDLCVGLLYEHRFAMLINTSATLILLLKGCIKCKCSLDGKRAGCSGCPREKWHCHEEECTNPDPGWGK